MATFPTAAKTVFGESEAKETSVTTPSADLRYRNHATLTARGWLAHHKSWPNDEQVKYTVAITYGDNRILIAVTPIGGRPRAS